MANQFYDKLKPLLGPGEKAVILVRPDPDSLASAWALAQLFRKRSSEAVIAIYEPIKRTENRTMVRELRIPTVPFQASMLETHSRRCIVDGQPNQFPELELKDWDIVIDHHPRVDGYTYKYDDVQPDIGATSSLLIHYLLDARVRISERLATALYYGIITDTDHFQRHISPTDAQAFVAIFPLVDHGIIREIEQIEIPQRYLNYFDLSFHRLKVENRRAVIHIGAADSADIAVILADFFLRVSGIQVVVISVVAQDKLILIFRSRNQRKDVGRIASGHFSDLGSAGGHSYAARAELPLGSLPAEVKLYNSDTVERFIEKRLGQAKVKNGGR